MNICLLGEGGAFSFVLYAPPSPASMLTFGSPRRYLPWASRRHQRPSSHGLPTEGSQFIPKTKLGAGQLQTVPSAYAQRANKGGGGCLPRGTHSTSEGVQSAMLLLEDNFCTLGGLTSVPYYTSTPDHEQRLSLPNLQQEARLSKTFIEGKA